MANLKYKECRGCAKLYSEHTKMYRDNKCRFCDSELYETKFRFRKELNEGFIDEVAKDESLLYNMYVKGNPENEAKVQRKIEILKAEVEDFDADTFLHDLKTKNGRLNMQNNTQTKCPKCGSTNIQLLRKKWSLLSGFFTNKVDRYCVNCGNKV